MTPRLASFATAVCLLCASTVALAAEATSNPQDANAVNEVLVRGTAPALPTSSPTTALAPAVNPELFRIGFHPTAKAVRFFVANPPKDAKTWRVVLAAKDGNALAQDSGTLPFPAAGRTIKCDALAAAGKYTLTLTLDGGEPLAIVKTFERIKFDWEGNDLGRQDILVPPFTEVVATGKAMTVDCILRKHTIDTSGFWSQVTSEDKPLLAGPMRLEVQAGGKTFTASGGGAKFTSSSTTAAAGTATWQAGPLAGSTDFSFDYDGACEFRLHLGPTEQPIDHLRLVIPMNAAEASLMHPVTTLLRSHYAGAIPAGEGKVWDSQKISRHQLPAPFVPYIWVGGPERGICWYADNDQGCITDPNAPAMEIIRDGPAVVLVVNLVTRPARIAAPRTLSFGLQATPAKPMPQQPYNWRRWWPVGTARNEADVDFNLWGASGYWGARSFVTDFWPAGRDYSFFDQLAKGRRTGKVDKGFLEQWLEKYAANTKPEDYANLKAHWNAGLSWAPINPWDDPNNAKRHWVMPYTSARSMAACPEFATYLDEWSICDVADPRWDAMRKGRLRPVREQPNGVWYEVDPVGTYVDMILAFHKKMYDTFADGIYWDNVFLQANYVPQDVGGPAYIDDDGRLRPGVNLRAFRSLARRNAIMMQQMGRMPLSWPHMTNTTIVPVLSFSQINYDWEWRDLGEFALKDAQDRLKVDGNTSLILAMSLGLQCGNVSVICDRYMPPKDSNVERKWLVRTVVATCVPHEIKFHIHDAGWAIKLLEDFGYGRDDCKVYRYWETPFPLAASGADVRALVLQRGPRVLLGIGSFGAGGDCKLTLDLKALGLSDSAKAVNAETNQPLDSPSPGTFILPIRKHDAAFVRVE